MENKVLEEVKQFSHIDLDGDACIVMAKKIFAHVTHTHCNYPDVDDKVREFIFQYINEDGKVIAICPYSLLLITDISVSMETAMMIDHFKDVTGIDVILIDHHKTALELRAFDWASIEPEIDGVKTSGTSEIYRLLVKENKILSSGVKEDLKIFAEQVRLYDTWDWKAKGLSEPRMLNELHSFMGHDAFIERFLKDLDPTLDEFETYLINAELKRIDRAVDAKLDQMFKADLYGYQVGIVYSEHNRSILGNVMCERNPDIDFAVIINISDAKVSFRSVKDNIDVGAISKELFGGGGHPASGGCEFDLDERATVFYHLLKSKTPTSN